mmetsp:Transcript_7602/g.11298  ORF Transcript_7602/g.11298 Transcript_7602/m.11298 type:complete len:156 (-) Transcript_7602:1516-1983(-)
MMAPVTFISEIEHLQDVYAIEEESGLLFTAVQGLAKTVTECYRTLPMTQCITWAAFQNAIRARFASHNQDMDLVAKLTRMKQREGATVNEYSKEFESRLEHLRRYDAECLREFMQTQLFVMGLRTYQQTYVRALPQQTLQHAIELAVNPRGVMRI